jgi:hypothetical protein
MRKMLCEIDLEIAQGYPGRYLESRPAGDRELIAKPGLGREFKLPGPFLGPGQVSFSFCRNFYRDQVSIDLRFLIALDLPTLWNQRRCSLSR